MVTMMPLKQFVVEVSHGDISNCMIFDCRQHCMICEEYDQETSLLLNQVVFVLIMVLLTLYIIAMMLHGHNDTKEKEKYFAKL